HLTPTGLRAWLGSRLPEHMVPAVYVQVSSLPLGPNGKVDRRALPEPNPTNTLRDTPFVAPRSPLEERICGMVLPLLHLEVISADDNFFLLGGHSLMGTQLIGRIAEAFGVELSLHTVFQAPTVALLAAEVERLLVDRLQAMSEEEAQHLLHGEEEGAAGHA
ncbi:MAG TPA: phosphopantetheine-binding protein, partial [Myxococcaceae bacterium]|nr:phosphopantetheine-binding protein [Myxococcaceae bacterium]